MQAVFWLTQLTSKDRFSCRPWSAKQKAKC